MYVHLGSFAEVARVLSEETGRPYTRQNIHQTWKRRSINGFPDRHECNIGGHVRLLFDIHEVRAWQRERG